VTVRFYYPLLCPIIADGLHVEFLVDKGRLTSNGDTNGVVRYKSS
jgi:hypothetical protein